MPAWYQAKLITQRSSREQYQSQSSKDVQAMNNLSYYPKWRSTILISVLYKKIRIPQASRSAKQMFIKKMTRTVKLISNQWSHQCVLRKNVKKIEILICGQWSHQWICGYPNQQYHTSTKGYAVTRTVNLQSATRNRIKWNLCVLTRTIKKLKISICGQWSQQWKQIRCSQWPDQIIRRQLNRNVTI